MKKLFCVLIFALSFTACYAQSSASDVPVSIRNVFVKRVNDNIVRVIQYNTEINKKFAIEILNPPKMSLTYRLDIIAIDTLWDGKMKHQEFEGSAGVFISDAKIEKNYVEFKVEYFGGGHTGGSTLSTCEVSIKKDILEKPVCKAE